MGFTVSAFRTRCRLLGFLGPNSYVQGHFRLIELHFPLQSFVLRIWLNKLVHFLFSVSTLRVHSVTHMHSSVDNGKLTFPINWFHIFVKKAAGRKSIDQVTIHFEKVHFRLSTLRCALNTHTVGLWLENDRTFQKTICFHLNDFS